MKPRNTSRLSRRDWNRLWAFAGALLVAACGYLAPEVPVPAPQPAAPGTTQLIGRVVGLADGDTITVLDAERRTHRIRLAGIDAPESTQPFGSRSRQALALLIHTRAVTAQCRAPDRYGRPLCKVFVGELDVNLEQVRKGMAWHYKAYERDQSPQDRQSYAQAEQAARIAGIGLWSEREPIPPWDFRKKARTAGR